jgi:purine-binding chemotaxis protein CheW
MIVPVIDLRVRFGIGDCAYLLTTVVLVLRCASGESERLMGLVVDAVSQGDKALTPALGDSVVTPFTVGLLNVEEQVMSLLDTDELLNMETILKAG